MTAPTIPARLLDQAKTRPSEAAYLHVQPVVRSKRAGQTTRKCTASDRPWLQPVSTPVVVYPWKQSTGVVEMDLGAMAIGAIPAGIYQTCSPEEIEYILNHSEAPIVLVENQSR